MNFNFYNFKSSYLSPPVRLVINYPKDFILHKGFLGIILKNMALKSIRACSLVMIQVGLLIITKVGIHALTVYDLVNKRLIILGSVFFQNTLSSIFLMI